MARSLSRSGFPTLRFFCQGYGDSHDLDGPPSLATHLRDTMDVLHQAPRVFGSDELGTIGARFGGAIAALVADRGELEHVAMISPVIRGADFAKEILRSQILAEMARGRGVGQTMDGLQAELQTDGTVNIQGWLLHREMFEQLQRLDLLRDLERFAGRALLLQLSRGAEVQPVLARLARRLEELGATAQLDVVTDQAASRFGYEHFHPIGKSALGDSLAQANATVAAKVAEWARLGAPAAASGKRPT